MPGPGDGGREGRGFGGRGGANRDKTGGGPPDRAGGPPGEGGFRGGPGGFRSRGPGGPRGGFRGGFRDRPAGLGGPGGPRGPGARGGFGPNRGAPRPGGRVAPPPLRILYEDETLLAVEKPAGMALSVPPGRDRRPGTMTMQDQVLTFLRERDGRKAGAWGVHELDKEASGIVVFARSPAAAESVRTAFAGKKADAIYLAVVGGAIESDAIVRAPGGSRGSEGAEAGASTESPSDTPDPRLAPGARPDAAATGTIRTFLRRTGTQVESIPVDEFSGDRASSTRPQAPRLAITHYKVVAAGRGRTLVRLRVKNPRMHQARVHMRDLGHEVVGDAQYGSREISPRVLLHLAEIAFPHPVTHKPLRLTCPAPAAFWDAIGAAPPSDAGHTLAAASRGTRPSQAERSADAGDGGWEHVAEWYETLVSERRSDLHDQVVTPGVLRLLAPRAGERIIDVACGPGELVRTLAGMGVDAVGVDASPTLVEAARERALADEPAAGGTPARFEVCDARDLASLPERLGAGPFNAATCVLALMNMDPLEDVAAGVGSILAPGGRFVAVILHPAFRSPGMASWGWAEQAGSGTGRSPMVRRQYRRVDGYLGPHAREVVMNPGAVSRGEKPVTTVTHHRPIGAYVDALAKAGLLVESLEEWASHRRSESGPRAAEEDRARREIPMFLALRAVKR